MANNLFLCRTPLQAFIISRILKEEAVTDFDLLYVVGKKSDEDVNYYKMLSAESNVSYMLEKYKLRYSIVSTLASYISCPSHFKNNDYENVYLASIDSILFGLVLTNLQYEGLVTFDDGSANIFPVSSYSMPKGPRRAGLYRRVLGVKTVDEMKSLSDKHYTIYRNFPNIVSEEKTDYIGGIDSNGHDDCLTESGPTFFIGQPFHQYLPAGAVNKLKAWMDAAGVDFYVQHPREESPIIDNVPILDKGGEIAEIAILEKCEGVKPTIIGGFSSVLLNIDESRARKIYLQIRGDKKEWNENAMSLMKQAGCDVVRI